MKRSVINPIKDYVYRLVASGDEERITAAQVEAFCTRLREKDPNPFRVLPYGRSSRVVDRMLQTLRRAGYIQYVSGEWIACTPKDSVEDHPEPEPEPEAKPAQVTVAGIMLSRASPLLGGRW